MTTPATRAAYELLTDEDEGRVCRDIPETACHEQPGNFVKHVGSLTATKTGDGLADPKLVLSWLLEALGAPAWQVGLLVPIREAGALLPQLGISAWIRGRPRRKWVWSAASVGQGLSVLGMAWAALALGDGSGAVAGGVILACLLSFALFRSGASVSYKDVLGKTVSKATRGTATGAAGSVASALVLLFGVLISLGVLPRTVPMVTGALLVAGLLWLMAAATFATLAEEAGATEGGGDPWRVAVRQMGLLKRRPQLVRFIGVRALLLATALAPPYFLILAGGDGGRALGDLGAFVIASSGASVVSAYVWGRLADRSSRRVLRAAGLVAAAVLGATAALAWTIPDMVRAPWVLPGLLFVLMVAYQGVRVGRSTHIVDMASAEDRAAYVAISNTTIGVLLLVGSVFGLVAQAAGEAAVLLVFAGMCFGAAVLAQGLDEVQAHDPTD
ncbi:MAG: MFS transporter [Gemmatimonadota bacterium]